MKKKLRLLMMTLLCAVVSSAWGQEPKVVLDFSSNEEWNIPTDAYQTKEGEFTNAAGYTIKLAGVGETNGYKYNTANSGNYVIMGKQGATLTFHSFNFKVGKIAITGTVGASAAVKQNIFVGDKAVSNETTGARDVTNEYAISSAYQTAGTIYVLKVTSAHNTQISKIEIYEVGASIKPIPEMSFEPTSVTATVGESVTPPNLTYKGDGTVTYSSSNETVATVDASTGALSLLSAGTTTITATATETNNYKSATAHYSLTVNNAAIDDNDDYSITFANLGLENSKQYLEPFDGGAFTVTFAGGSNDGKYYTTGQGVRVYGDGSFTVSAKAGNLTQIVITYDGDYKPESADVVDTGDYDVETGTWTGNASSVTFTRPTGSGHWRVQVISVTTDGSTVQRKTPEIAFSAASLEATIGGAFTEPKLSYNGDGAITYSISDQSVATINANTGKLTLVAAGTATVTATAAETANYKKGTATYSLTVNAAAENENNTIIFSDLGLENGVQYTEPFDAGTFTVTFAGGANDGKYYNTGQGVRVYGDGSFTIDSKAGNIVQITITYDGNNKPESADVVNTGTYNPETGVWTGKATSVCFTRPTSSGHWRIQKIAVIFDDNVSKLNPSLSVADITLTEGETKGIIISTQSDGALNLSTSNESVAKISGSGSSFKVSAVSVGSAIVTVSQAESAQYVAATTTFNVKVNALSTPSVLINNFEWLEPDNTVEVVVGEPYQLKFSCSNNNLPFTNEYATSWVHYDFSGGQHVIDTPTGYSISDKGVITGLVPGSYAIKFTGWILAKDGADKWLYINVISEKRESESNNTLDTANDIFTKIRFGLYNISDIDYFKYTNDNLKRGDNVIFKIHYYGLREDPFGYKWAIFCGTNMVSGGSLMSQDQECKALVTGGNTVYLEVYYDQSRSQYFNNGEEFVAEVFINGEPAGYITPDEQKNMINGHEYVDLGLPSGILWATSNYGATSPSEFGTYVTWSSNDIVSENWGEEWSTPKNSDFDEIIYNCTWSWERKDGVDGYMVKGSNGNTLFLPAAGFQILGSSQSVGTVYCWTSTPSFEGGFTIAFTGNSSSKNTNTTYNIGFVSMPIRPIAASTTSPDNPQPDDESIAGVDLGLSVLWGNMNIGATKPEENGYYFAWGEIVPNKSVYDETTYTDPNVSNISGTEYDAAYITSDGIWRLPTYNEFVELINKCTWEFTQVNSINGYKVIGKNGNSIFLPFVGGKENNYSVGYSEYGYYGQGFYASGTVFPYEYGYNWYLYMDTDPRYGMYGYKKTRGQTIRPVQDLPNKIDANIYNQTDTITDVYTPTGQLVLKKVNLREAAKNLPRGLYIAKGKKFMVK